ncbi:MAG: hypothetical protein LKM40_00570 [Mageeibacillus sp.]|nr:hypothetical protein [Mageeibacillus sp.]
MLEHNIMCYGLFKVSPVAIQPLIYSNGTYNILSYADAKSGWQSFTGTSVAVGHNQLFEAAYSALTSLADMTVIDDGSSNNILLYTCDSTHDVALLQEPEYLPEDRVDNTEYDNAPPPPPQHGQIYRERQNHEHANRRGLCAIRVQHGVIPCAWRLV